MALCSKIKVPMSKKGITVRGNGKNRYVYKVISAYRNEKNQPTNTRKAIGKVDNESGTLIPNDAYWQFYSDEMAKKKHYVDPTFKSVHAVGATYLIQQVFRSLNITELLNNVFGSRASSIMLACAYMVCRGNVFQGVVDWCESYTLEQEILTSQSSSSLFSSITHEERMNFLQAWIATHPTNEYYAYEVTSFSS